MKANWVAFLRGYLFMQLSGENVESFVNAAIKNKIELWEITAIKNEEITFGVSIPDFFRIRPLVRITKCKARIMDKRGLPFQLAKLRNRKIFAVGMIIFVFSLFLLSTLVWNVRIEGNINLEDAKILAAARAEGIYGLQSSLRLPDEATLAQRLALRLPDVSWVGVKKEGTSIVITVIESIQPEKKTLRGPRHLISKADAVITKVIAENGRSKVQRNSRVRKGDILISGLIGSETNYKKVVSKGTVFGLVWYEYRIVSPLETKVKIFTGAIKERNYIMFGRRALQISGYGGPDFRKSEVRTEMHWFELSGRKFPFGKMKETEFEVKNVHKSLTPGQAKAEGLAQVRYELLAKCGKDANIKAEKILHEQTDNGKVKLNVLMEVEQSLTKEQLIY